MRLITAEQVPEAFGAMLAIREQGEHARVLSMTADFKHNPFMDLLIEFGSEEDVLAVSQFGHTHGANASFNFSQIVLTAGLVPLGANGGPRYVHQFLRSRFLSDFKGKYVTTNTSNKYVPYIGSLMGQSHIKAFTVGDRILSLGGVNATAASPLFTDVMVEFQSPKFASFVDEFIERKGDFNSESRPGRLIEHDDRNLIIIDHGHEGQSPILKSHLIDFSRTPTRIVESSNYAPSGAYRDALVSCAQKGASVITLPNHWTVFFDHHNHSRLSAVANGIAAMGARRRGLNVDNPRRQWFNHLKSCEIEYAGGERVAYIRSSNLARLAMGVGTCEVALRTTDEQLINELVEYRDQRLRPQSLHTIDN